MIRRNMNRYALVVLLLLRAPWAAALAQQVPHASPPSVRIGPLRLEAVSLSKVVNGDCPGRPCLEVHIDTLKVVSAESAQAAGRISAEITDWELRTVDGVQASPKSPQEVLQQFVDLYGKAHQGNPEDSHDFNFPWWLGRAVKIEFQSARVLCLTFEEDYSEGGATFHGFEELNYVNFRPSTGERILLSDLFKDGFEAPLNAVAERRIRESKGLGPRDSLRDIGFLEDRFALNDKFSIGNQGLTFHFEPGETTDYASGGAEILLPYADIKDLLRPDADVP